MKSKKAMSGAVLRIIKIVILILIVMLVFPPIYKSLTGDTFSYFDGVLEMFGMGPKKVESIKLDKEDYSAVIEFEEDTPFYSNIIYRFRKGRWMWKSPDAGASYKKYMPVTEIKDTDFDSEYKRITMALDGKNRLDGAKHLQSEINNDDDGYLILHYTNGCVVTTDEDIPMTNLYDWIQDPNEPIKTTQIKIVESYSGCPEGFVIQ